MRTYNFIYVINGIECQIEVNATDEESARETIAFIIPSASQIILIP